MSRGMLIRSNLSLETLKAMRDVHNYGEATQTAIKGVVRNGTKAVYDAAWRKAPMKSGNLRAGIHQKYDDTNNIGTVTSRAPHGHLVEFGTNKRFVYSPNMGGKHARLMPDGRFVKGLTSAGSMPSRPFMRPAIEQERPKINAAMERVLKKC